MLELESRLRELRTNPSFLGQSLHWLPETVSTQDDCRRLTEETDGSVVVIADRQLAGRGQYGRKWEAPSGLGLLMSFSLAGAPPGSAALSTWAAAAVASVLRRRFGLPAKVKWPNDVLVGGRKIAGVLVEVRGVAVIGVGVNVLQRPSDFPDDCRLPPTSIAMENNAAPDRVAVAALLLDELERFGSPTEIEVQRRIFDAWKPRLDVQPGMPAIATLQDGSHEGELLDIDLLDGVRLRSATGVIRIPLARLVRLEPIDDGARSASKG